MVLGSQRAASHHPPPLLGHSDTFQVISSLFVISPNTSFANLSPVVATILAKKTCSQFLHKGCLSSNDDSQDRLFRFFEERSAIKAQLGRHTRRHRLRSLGHSQSTGLGPAKALSPRQMAAGARNQPNEVVKSPRHSMTCKPAMNGLASSQDPSIAYRSPFR